MRLRPGRPDLADYTKYLDAPQAAADAALTVTWAGVTTLLVDDGSSAHAASSVSVRTAAPRAALFATLRCAA